MGRLLIPSWQSRVVVCTRTALGLGLALPLCFHPWLVGLTWGTALLIPFSAILAMALSTGASVAMTWRRSMSGGLAAAYCSLVLSLLPHTPAALLPCIALACAVLTYSSATLVVKRLTMSTITICLMLFLGAPASTAALPPPLRLACMMWLALVIGALSGLAAALLPLPEPALVNGSVSLTWPRVDSSSADVRERSSVLLRSVLHGTSTLVDALLPSQSSALAGTGAPQDLHVAEADDIMDAADASLVLLAKTVEDSWWEPAHLMETAAELNRAHAAAADSSSNKDPLPFTHRAEAWLAALRKLTRLLAGLRDAAAELSTAAAAGAVASACTHKAAEQYARTLRAPAQELVAALDVYGRAALQWCLRDVSGHALLPRCGSVQAAAARQPEELAHLRAMVDDRLAALCHEYAQARRRLLRDRDSCAPAPGGGAGAMPEAASAGGEAPQALDTAVFLLLRMSSRLYHAIAECERASKEEESKPAQPTAAPSLLRAYLKWAGFTWSAQRAWNAVKLSVAVVITAGIVLAMGPSAGAYPFWGPATVVLLQGSSQGGSYRQAVFRVVGTLLGSMVGYGAVAIANGNLWILGALLCVWAAVVTYARVDAVRGYWASVAAFTAVIVAIGAAGTRDDVASALALDRIKLNCIGALVYVLISAVLAPVSARDLLQQSLRAAITACATCVPAVFNSLSTTVGEHDEGRSGAAAPAAADATSALAAVDSTLLNLPSLIAEAEFEPDLARPAFQPQRRRMQEMGHHLAAACRALRMLQQASLAVNREIRQGGSPSPTPTPTPTPTAAAQPSGAAAFTSKDSGASVDARGGAEDTTAILVAVPSFILPPSGPAATTAAAASSSDSAAPAAAHTVHTPALQTLATVAGLPDALQDVQQSLQEVLHAAAAALAPTAAGGHSLLHCCGRKPSAPAPVPSTPLRPTAMGLTSPGTAAAARVRASSAVAFDIAAAEMAVLDTALQRLVITHAACDAAFHALHTAAATSHLSSLDQLCMRTAAHAVARAVLAATSVAAVAASMRRLLHPHPALSI